ILDNIFRDPQRYARDFQKIEHPDGLMGRHLETGIFHFQQVGLDRIDQIFKPLAVNSDPSLNSKAPFPAP
ncbi:MAG: hypothetical protein EBU57_09700, partial [Alphaproteobacteria bacterium]|nr:hypothetical protein [Alphaproteobacteria bacterium]